MSICCVTHGRYSAFHRRQYTLEVFLFVLFLPKPHAVHLHNYCSNYCLNYKSNETHNVEGPTPRICLGPLMINPSMAVNNLCFSV